MESIKRVNVEGKKVIVRVDFNVPIKDGKITDDTRIVSSLKTIKYLVTHNAKVILLSHLGRVASQEDKEKKTPLPIQLGRQSMRRSFLRKSIHTSKNSPQRMNKLFDDEVKYINNDKTEDQIKEDYEEEKEFIISSHMNVIKDEAKMLTEEGGLISRLKGVNNEQSLSMDEYANKIEKIVSKKLKYYMELKKKISNFKKMNI